MNVFIDAGSFDGRSTRTFREHYPGGASYVVHCFEPDVRVENHEPDITIHREAVWTHDGEIHLWIGDPQASSVMAGKTTGHLSRNILVPCVDFSRWIERFDSPVVLKLDIEGAEYSVLRKMLDDGTIRLVGELFCDWHAEKVGIPNDVHNDLLYELKRCGIRPRTMHDGRIA